MMYEEDNIGYHCQIQGSDTFLNALLNQKSESKEPCQILQERNQKQEVSIIPIDLDQENSNLFSIRLLQQKDQLNCYIPEKPFQEHPEEDMILLKTLNKRVYEEICQQTKKQEKNNKVAYHQQNRRIKIERYRIKKARRKWDRKIFYDCRKFVADHRERVNGRFVKKSPFVKSIEYTHKNSLATGEIEIPKQLLESSKGFQVQEIFLS